MKTCAWCIEELSKSVDGIEVDDDGNEVCPECYSGYEAQMHRDAVKIAI